MLHLSNFNTDKSKFSAGDIISLNINDITKELNFIISSTIEYNQGDDTIEMPGWVPNLSISSVDLSNDNGKKYIILSSEDKNLSTSIQINDTFKIQDLVPNLSISNVDSSNVNTKKYIILPFIDNQEYQPTYSSGITFITDIINNLIINTNDKHDKSYEINTGFIKSFENNQNAENQTLGINNMANFEANTATNSGGAVYENIFSTLWLQHSNSINNNDNNHNENRYENEHQGGVIGNRDYSIDNVANRANKPESIETQLKKEVNSPVEARWALGYEILTADTSEDTNKVLSADISNNTNKDNNKIAILTADADNSTDTTLNRELNKKMSIGEIMNRLEFTSNNIVISNNKLENINHSLNKIELKISEMPTAEQILQMYADNDDNMQKELEEYIEEIMLIANQNSAIVAEHQYNQAVLSLLQ